MRGAATGMTDWQFAQRATLLRNSRSCIFSRCASGSPGDVEFIITVFEYVSRNQLNMSFYARADKEVNQKTAPFTPFGWGDSIVRALTECKKQTQDYPYEP